MREDGKAGRRGNLHRADRLATALRENLRRRKAQQRARRERPEETPLEIGAEGKIPEPPTGKSV